MIEKTYWKNKKFPANHDNYGLDKSDRIPYDTKCETCGLSSGEHLNSMDGNYNLCPVR